MKSGILFLLGLILSLSLGCSQNLNLPSSQPEAGLYDQQTREMKFLKIWTGEMKSREITVEIV
jgi:hypothetical protein